MENLDKIYTQAIKIELEKVFGEIEKIYPEKKIFCFAILTCHRKSEGERARTLI